MDNTSCVRRVERQVLPLTTHYHRHEEEMITCYDQVLNELEAKRIGGFGEEVDGKSELEHSGGVVGDVAIVNAVRSTANKTHGNVCRCESVCESVCESGSVVVIVAIVCIFLFL